LSNPTANPLDDHRLAWMDRLQDRLDGDLDEAERREVDAHLADCTSCQAQLAQFEALDQVLLAATPRLSLDAAFDARLLSEIDAIDEQQRTRLRERIEQERQETLRGLSRRWRQSLAFVVPGVIAGIALALALLGWLPHSGVSQAFVSEGANELGSQSTVYLQAFTIALLGGGIGLTVARWLSSAAD